MIKCVRVYILVIFVIECVCLKHAPRSYTYHSKYDHYFDVEGNKFLCLVIGICSFSTGQAAKPNLNLVYEWHQLEFDYASEAARQEDIEAEVFIPGKPAPIDVDVYYSDDTKKNKIFVTIPRFQPGVPVTLGTVTSKVRETNPIIKPYPSWEWQTHPTACKNDRIISVFRVMIDHCDRLWVLDTGKILEKQVCPPQILAFDLKTNQLIHKHEIAEHLMTDTILLVTPVVDIREDCSDVFVYAADCQSFSIFVHDVKNENTWKAIDKTMYPNPDYGTYTIQGDSFDLMDGVLGMALEPYKPGRNRRLFYHAMSSSTENFVQTSYLRNSTIFEENPSSSPHLFKTYKGRRHTQSAAEAIDKNGIMYFGLMSDVKIACFNTAGEYNGKDTCDIVANDPVKLQFASGVKVIKNKKSVEELWILTSRFQKVATGTLNTHEVNFRIQAAKVEDIVYGSSCSSGKRRENTGGGYGFHAKL